MVKLLFYVLVIPFISQVLSEKSSSSSCKPYSNQQLYLSQTPVLAKIKNIKKTKYGYFLKIKIAKLYRENSEITGRGETLVVQYSLQMCNKLKLRKNRSYIFILNKGEFHWEVRPHPIKSNKRKRKTIKTLFCKSCKKIQPRLKNMRKSSTVKEGRRYKIKCRLQYPPILPVTFLWMYENKNISETENYSMKTRRRGSDLVVRGRGDTAGKYTCVAKSQGGSASTSTLMYVKGKGTEICLANYCLNGGHCSVVKLGGGERELSCACPIGFQGLRCEVKYVPLNVITPIIIFIIAIGVILLFYYLYHRIKNVERKLIKKRSSYSHIEIQESDIYNEAKKDITFDNGGLNVKFPFTITRSPFQKNETESGTSKVLTRDISTNSSQPDGNLILSEAKISLCRETAILDSDTFTLIDHNTGLAAINATLPIAKTLPSGDNSDLKADTSSQGDDNFTQEENSGQSGKTSIQNRETFNLTGPSSTLVTSTNVEDVSPSSPAETSSPSSSILDSSSSTLDEPTSTKVESTTSTLTLPTSNPSTLTLSTSTLTDSNPSTSSLCPLVRNTSSPSTPTASTNSLCTLARNTSFSSTLTSSTNSLCTVARNTSCSSPVYCDPWDAAVSLCVHGGDICCTICDQEAEDIIRQCNNYFKK